MKSIELVPKLLKNKYTDFYGIGQVVHRDEETTLLDCGFPTARIVGGKFQMLVLHPTGLEFDLMREFGWQYGIKSVKDLNVTEMRRKYGVNKYLEAQNA